MQTAERFRVTKLFGGIAKHFGGLVWWTIQTSWWTSLVDWFGGKPYPKFNKNNNRKLFKQGFLLLYIICLITVPNV